MSVACTWGIVPFIFFTDKCGEDLDDNMSEILSEEYCSFPSFGDGQTIVAETQSGEYATEVQLVTRSCPLFTEKCGEFCCGVVLEDLGRMMTCKENHMCGGSYYSWHCTVVVVFAG